MPIKKVILTKVFALNKVAWYFCWWSVGSAEQSYADQTSLTQNNRQEDKVISVTSHRWSWVAAPPGAAELGATVDYAGLINVEDVNFRP